MYIYKSFDRTVSKLITEMKEKLNDNLHLKYIQKLASSISDRIFSWSSTSFCRIQQLSYSF